MHRNLETLLQEQSTLLASLVASYCLSSHTLPLQTPHLSWTYFVKVSHPPSSRADKHHPRPRQRFKSFRSRGELSFVATSSFCVCGATNKRRPTRSKRGAATRQRTNRTCFGVPDKHFALLFVRGALAVKTLETENLRVASDVHEQSDLSME